jgi:hypothetical protein
MNQAVQSLCSLPVFPVFLWSYSVDSYFPSTFYHSVSTQFSILIPQTAVTASLNLLSTDVRLSGAFEGREINTNGLSMNMTTEKCHTKISVNIKYLFQN